MASFEDRFSNFIKNVGSKVQGSVNAAQEKVQGGFQNARNEVSENVNSFEDRFSGFINRGQDRVDNSIDRAEKKTQEIRSGFEDRFNNFINTTKDKVESGYNQTNQGVGRVNPGSVLRGVGKIGKAGFDTLSIQNDVKTLDQVNQKRFDSAKRGETYNPSIEENISEVSVALSMFPGAGITSKGGKGLAKVARKTGNILETLSPEVSDYVARQTAREEAAKAGDKLLFTEKLKQAKNTLKRKFSNKEAYIEDVIEKEAKKQGKDVSGSVFDFQAEKFKKQGLATIVDKEIKDSGFESLINDVPDYDLFSRYTSAKQKLHRIEQGKEVGQSAGNVDVALESQLVSELGPIMQPFSEKLKNINYKLLDDEVRYGFRSADEAAMLKRENPYYVPLNRIYNEVEQEALSGAGRMSQGGASPRSLLKKMEGSDREIVDPIESIYERFIHVNNAGLNNKTRQAIVNTFDNLENPFKLTPQRLAKDVIERKNIYSAMAKNNEAIQPLLRETSDITRQLKKTTVKKLQEELSTLADHAQALASEMESKSTIKPLVDKMYTRQNKIQNILSKKQILEADKKYLEESISFFRQKNKDLFKEVRSLSDIKKSPGENTFSVWKDGVEERWESEDPQLMKALLSSGSGQVEGAGKALLALQRVFKFGTTGINPAFALPNFAVDQISGAINSKYARTMADPVVNFHALMAAIGKGKYIDEIKKSGAMTTSFDLTRKNTAQSLEKIRSKKNIGTRAAYAINHPIKTADDLIRVLEDIVGTTERFTRAQQYIGAKKAATKTGKGIEYAESEALKSSKKNTANFQDQGEFGAVMRMWSPYLAAGIQGVRSTAGALKRRPLSTSAKIGTFVVAPAMAAAYYNLSDEKRASAYKDLNPTEKKNNIIIFPPGDPVQNEDGSWNVIKFKIPPQLANLASVGAQIVEAQYDSSEAPEFSDLAKAVIGLYSPAGTEKGDIAGLVAGPFKPEVEQYANKNLYFNTPIVSSGIEQLPAEQQAKEGTPRTLSLAAQLVKNKTGVGISPARADAYLRSRFGSITPQVLNSVDRFLVGVDVLDEEGGVGGTSPLDATFARFAKARGGEKGQENYTFIDNLDKKQDAESNKLNKEADILYQDLKNMPKEERKKKYMEIEDADSDMAERINNAAADDELKLEPWEKSLRSLNVKNGARTYAIYKITKDMSANERYIFAERMGNAGIISDEVNSQLNELYSDEKTIVPILQNKFAQ